MSDMDETRAPEPPPLLLAALTHDGCQLLHDFLNGAVRKRVSDAVAGTSGSDAATLGGIFLRAVAWMRSICKLDHPSDFQAVVAASRSLFEIAVDTTLMRFDTSNPPSKMLAWEDSAKLKAAVRIAGYCARAQIPASDYAAQHRYLQTDKLRVEALRERYWPRKTGNAKHPERWTGRSLEQDAARATALSSDVDFVDYYEARYAQTCWNTHGSGLAGVRNVSEEAFPGIAALAMRDCTRFAVTAAENVLRCLSAWCVSPGGIRGQPFSTNVRCREGARNRSTA